MYSPLGSLVLPLGEPHKWVASALRRAVVQGPAGQL